MIVCHCRAVCDRQVREAISQGADSRGKVARRCGAGSLCGGCHPLIDEILRERSGPRRESSLRLELGPAR